MNSELEARIQRRERIFLSILQGLYACPDVTGTGRALADKSLLDAEEALSVLEAADAKLRSSEPVAPTAGKLQAGDYEALQARVTELEDWKASALAVESEWAPHEVAKLLDLELGTSIRAGIAPAIKQLQARITELEGAYKFVSDSLRQELLENAKLRAALEPTLCRAYTIGVQRGHESTVDGRFTPIHWLDEATYFAEDVKELMEDSLPELKAALNGEEPAP